MSTPVQPPDGQRKYTNARVQIGPWRKLIVVAWRKRMSRTALLNQMIATVVNAAPDPTPQELAEGCPNPNEMIDTPPVADSMHEPLPAAR